MIHMDIQNGDIRSNFMIFKRKNQRFRILKRFDLYCTLRFARLLLQNLSGIGEMELVIIAKHKVNY